MVQLKQGTAYTLSNNMHTKSQTGHVYESHYLNRRLLHASLGMTIVVSNYLYRGTMDQNMTTILSK